MVLKDIPVENNKYFSMGWGGRGDGGGIMVTKTCFAFYPCFVHIWHSIFKMIDHPIIKLLQYTVNNTVPDIFSFFFFLRESQGRILCILTAVKY